jgi:hypothetical protein
MQITLTALLKEMSFSTYIEKTPKVLTNEKYTEGRIQM